MSTATVSSFDSTLQQTHHWLDQVTEELGRGDRQQAYRVLRAVLLVLRDRLTVEEATDLGAQLPMLVRGIYYEQWNPSKVPTRDRKREDFLAHIAESTQEQGDGDPEALARAVFSVLDRNITEGQVNDVKSNLPEDIRLLWP